MPHDAEQAPVLTAKGRKRGLGRGLSALFDDTEDDTVKSDLAYHETTQQNARRTLGVDQLEAGTFQPRQFMEPDALAELTESIAMHGVLQPILVRPARGRDDRFEIIAGERRWRAAQRAQLHEVPVIIKDFDDTIALQVALIENLQRENLNAIEEAAGYRRLMDEFGHSQERLAAAMGKSRSHVANMLRLLNLPASVLEAVQAGKLTAGHARALVTAADPEALMGQILTGGLSVRETERLAAAHSRAGKKLRTKIEKDIDTLALEVELTGALGMKVTLDMAGQGGAVRIAFKSLDQLDAIVGLVARGRNGRIAV